MVARRQGDKVEVNPKSQLLNARARWFWHYGLLLLLVGLVWQLARPAAAQESTATDWSTPVLVWAPRQGEESVRAEIVADSYGQAHVVVLVRQEEGETRNDSLFYTRGRGDLWTEPIDVIATSGDLPVLTWDNHNYIQFTSRSAELMAASVFDVPSAQGWFEFSAPFAPAGILYPAVAADQQGGIHAVYPQPGGSIFYTRLQEDGLWTTPVNVSASAADRGTDWPRMTVDEQGRIHVVWTELQLPNAWPPTGVYYSQSTDGGLSWSEPIQMAADGYDEINVVTGPDDVVHVAWNGMVAIEGRYHRWSADGGLTWSGTTMITEKGATEGWPQLAVDSSGKLHFLSSLLTVVTYATWDGEQWSEMQPIFGNRERPLGGERPRMVISEGNRLHVLLLGREGTGWWYLTRTTDAPAEEVLPTPLPTAVPSPTPTATPEATATASTLADQIDEAGIADPQPPLTEPGTVVWYGVLPAMILIAAAIIIARRPGRR